MPLCPLKLEWRGHDADKLVKQADGRYMFRPWVARVSAYEWPGRFKREFVDGQIDYSEANGPGSRGVHLYFHLAAGEVYEVKAHKRRYFCTTDGESITELTREQVTEFLVRGS